MHQVFSTGWGAVVAGVILAGGGWALVAEPALGQEPAARAPLAAPVVAAPLVSAAEPYLPAKPVVGKLALVGSRTMSQLAAVWSDGFRHIHPEAEISLDFQGSGTALAQLTPGGATLGLLSRDLSPAEAAEFATKNPGGKLIPVATAYDALAVVVHGENPLEGLTLPQLRRLFGRGEGDKPLSWGDLGLTGQWAELPVARFSPGEQSGARGQFQTVVLGEGGEFAELTTFDWHTRIVEEVGARRGAIGFVSLANARSPLVRVVPLAAAELAPAVLPTPERIAERSYPLIRPLTLVLAVPESGPGEGLASEFVRYVLSRNGQEDVVKDGFQPLARSEVFAQHDRLGWTTLK